MASLGQNVLTTRLDSPTLVMEVMTMGTKGTFGLAGYAGGAAIKTGTMAVAAPFHLTAKVATTHGQGRCPTCGKHVGFGCCCQKG